MKKIFIFLFLITVSKLGAVPYGGSDNYVHESSKRLWSSAFKTAVECLIIRQQLLNLPMTEMNLLYSNFFTTEEVATFSKNYQSELNNSVENLKKELKALCNFLLRECDSDIQLQSLLTAVGNKRIDSSRSWKDFLEEYTVYLEEKPKIRTIIFVYFNLDAIIIKEDNNDTFSLELAQPCVKEYIKKINKPKESHFRPVGRFCFKVLQQIFTVSA